MQHILHSSRSNKKKKEYQHSISHKTNMYLYDAYKRTISFYLFNYSSHSNEKTKKKEKEYHKTQEIKIEIVEVVDRTQQP